MPTNPISVDTAGASQMTSLSMSYLRNLRIYDVDNSPPFVRVGRRVLYPLDGPNGLRAWIENRASIA